MRTLTSDPAQAQQDAALRGDAAKTSVVGEASKWSPPLEIGLFIGLVLVADLVFGSGRRFTDVEPHPFWIIVLLMAVQYGTREALLATGVSSCALLLGNMPPQGFEQNVHEYALQVLQNPLLWMLASVVLGELRVRHHLQHTETVDQLSNAERRVELLSRAHGDLTSAKERLETRLAGQMRTATGMFEAARSLETLDPAKVLAGATELLTVALNAKAFSLFLLQGDTLVLAAAQGWNQDHSSAERYPTTAPLFMEVVGAQRFVSVATPAGEAVLQGQGLMAGPLIDPATGKLFGMLKIEEMAFLDFNLSSVQTFKAMCGWIAAAYANAVAHKASQIEDESTRLYGMKYLDRQTNYMIEVARRFGFDLTLLFFRVETQGLPEAERRALPAMLGEVARTVLRRTDLMFSHEPPGTQFAVLLPGAPPEHAVVVTRKLVEGLRDASGRDIPCTTRVRALCRANESTVRTGMRTTPVAEPDMVA